MKYRGAIRTVNDLGPMLAQARYAAGLTQRDLAKSIGVTQRYIWQLESGEPTRFAVRFFEAMSAVGMTLTAEFAAPEEAADDHS